MERGPAESLHQQDAEACACAVDQHIFDGRTASFYKGLMIFVKAGKAYTDRSGKKDQPYTADTVHIEGKGHRDGQQKILGQMGCFPYIVLDGMCLLRQLIKRQLRIQDFVFGLHQLIADLIA